MANRVVHFEIYAQDVDRAKKFYADVFGWTYQTWEFGGEPYYGILTAPEGSKELGINGGLLRRPGPAPVEGQAVIGYACTIQVENIDETIKKIEDCGGTLALAKMAIPGMAWQAYYKDSEGNIFGIHQPDKEAK
jgi:predicted enzyme related to lactoylglutathione lyase